MPDRFAAKPLRLQAAALRTKGAGGMGAKPFRFCTGLGGSGMLCKDRVRDTTLEKHIPEVTRKSPQHHVMFDEFAGRWFHKAPQGGRIPGGPRILE